MPLFDPVRAGCLDEAAQTTDRAAAPVGGDGGVLGTVEGRDPARIETALAGEVGDPAVPAGARRAKALAKMRGDLFERLRIAKVRGLDQKSQFIKIVAALKTRRRRPRRGFPVHMVRSHCPRRMAQQPDRPPSLKSLTKPAWVGAAAQLCDTRLLHRVCFAMGFHIFRREAVYYWRRRPPRVLANLFDRQHLFVSLKTTSHIVARRLAAQLDLILKDAAMLAEGDLNLSRSQIETMLRGVVDGHLAKLDRIALAAKSAPGFDPERARIDDKRAFWTYALLEAQGFAAVVRAEDRDRMTADGLANADIEAVQDHLAMLRSNGLVPTKHHILRQMIDAVGAVPTAMNIDVAQGTYFRAMKLALAEIDRRYGGRRAEDGGFVDRMLLSKVDPQQQVVSFPTGSDVRPSDPPSDENRPAAQCVAMADFSKFAEDVMSQNAKDGHWDDKTQRQVRSIADLFVRFMLQDQHVQDLDSLRQLHLGRFVDFLRSEIYVHYSKSAKDEHLTIAQIREDALSRNKNKRGIGGDTLNRHLSNLGQIFRHAGISAKDEIEPSLSEIGRHAPANY